MTQSSEEIARMLKDAHAMTDVTGFGLAGHLAGICDASGVAANVRLGDVPLLDGAFALAEAGVRSSLFPDNRNDPRVAAPDTARGDLMFDPQTCGGLLAAIPRSQAEDLRNLWIIGEITKGSGVTFS
jgi:selenide,water dikinase